jgi:hypothetical protein
LLFVAPGWAAIGDNAPPVPSTYNTDHPRLPHPDQAYLTSLAGNSTVLARYNADADAWNSTNPSSDWYLRRLLIAYMANKTANPTKTAGYLNKIKALANLAGVWGSLLYSVDDGVATGTNTVTSASSNFLTACGGASCAGKVLAIAGKSYSIVSATTNTLTMPAGWIVSSGTNLKLRITNSGTGRPAAIAIIYDWLYNDLDAATRTEFGTIKRSLHEI